MESGEIFGELSLILDENRKASVKAISPSEIIEINKTALEAILLSSNIELHKMIQQMSKELGKSSDYRLPITKKDLMELVKTLLMLLELFLCNYITDCLKGFFNEKN